MRQPDGSAVRWVSHNERATCLLTLPPRCRDGGTIPLGTFPHPGSGDAPLPSYGAMGMVLGAKEVPLVNRQLRAVSQWLVDAGPRQGSRVS
jgi:hypothetical protein